MLKRPYLSLNNLANHLRKNEWKKLEILYQQSALTINDYKRIVNAAGMDDLLRNGAYGLHGMVISYHSNWLYSYLEVPHEAGVAASTQKIIDNHAEFATKYILSLNPYDIEKKEILQLLHCLNRAVQNVHFWPNQEASEQALLGCLFAQAERLNLPISAEWMEIKATLAPLKTWIEFENANATGLTVQMGVNKLSI
jgi:hypothetical protein